MRIACLFHTHVYGRAIEKEASRISSACRDWADFHILLDATNADLRDQWGRFPVFAFTLDDVKSLGYRLYRQKLTPGSTHFPLIHFSRIYPDYQYIWLVEHDVRFTGDWRRLFSHFRDDTSDLLTTHIRGYTEEPEWVWWDIEHPRQHIDLHGRIRSFNTIYRISRRSLEFIDQAHLDGWRGHHECLVPTLLFRNDFKIRDLGGNGRFVPPSDKNRFYIDTRRHDPRGELRSGTMRWRPIYFSQGWRKDKLYHPVKSELGFRLFIRKRAADWVRQIKRRWPL